MSEKEHAYLTMPSRYRLLDVGEEIQKGDLYLSTSGTWAPTPLFSEHGLVVTVKDNSVYFCRDQMLALPDVGLTSCPKEETASRWDEI